MIVDEPIPRQGPLTLDDVESEISAAAGAVSSLLSAVRSLPKVDGDGGSECPFAAELYAKKEALQQQVSACVGRLYECLQAVEGEIQRLQRNLLVVSAHEDMINSDSVRRPFTDAEAKLAALAKRYVRTRDRLKETIDEVHKALMEASRKSWPGELPQPRPASPEGPRNEAAERELDDLFERDRRRLERGKER